MALLGDTEAIGKTQRKKEINIMRDNNNSGQQNKWRSSSRNNNTSHRRPTVIRRPQVSRNTRNSDNSHGSSFASLSSLDPANKAVSPLQREGFRIIPLGGQGEIGRNCVAYEQEQEIIIVDAGLGIAPHGVKGGVDFLLPSLDHLQANKDKIKALLVTNSHEEHAGSFLQMLKELEIKQVFLPEILSEMYGEQLKSLKTEVVILKSESEYQVGSKFSVQAFRVGHCTAGAFSFLIKTKSISLLHVSAFKIDHTPPIANMTTDLINLTSTVSRRGVDVLVSGSLNCEEQGYSASEQSVYPKIGQLISTAKARVVCIIGQSYLQRLRLLLQLARETSRKVYFYGKESRKWFEAAKELDYFAGLDLRDLLTDSLDEHNRENILIIIGELEGRILQPLLDLAYGANQDITLDSEDLILFSGEQPLGSTRKLAGAIDQLFLRGIRVIGGKNAGIHVSRSACTEELKFLYNVAQPKYFLPINGEVRQLILHAELMSACGVDPQKILIVNNGNAVDLSDEGRKAEVVGKVEADPVFFSENLGSAMEQRSIDERQMLAEEGSLIVAFSIDKEKTKITSRPLIKASGHSLSASPKWTEIEHNLKEEVELCIQKIIKGKSQELSLYKRMIRDTLIKKLREHFGMFSPSISVIIQEI